MNADQRIDWVERYLDGELSPAEVEVFRAALHTDPALEAELASMTRVFSALHDAPLLDLPSGLTERVLDHVLPARVRSRWIRALGWSYAASAAATAAVVTALLVLPAPRAGIAWLSMAASSALARTLVLVLEAVSFSLTSVAGGWGLMHGLSERLAPLGRAAGAVFGHSAVLTTLTIAIMACALLLRWMRQRDAGTHGEVRRVSILGF